MNNSVKDVMDYVVEEDVKFIRLAFCDLTGKLKNAAIQPEELMRAFSDGIEFDGSAIDGFMPEKKSDLFLFPDPTTLTLLPWRPTHGKVIRLFCDVKYPDRTPHELDSRQILKNAIAYAKSKGISCNFGTEFEFYLFKLDENGVRTDVPCDNGGYMDVAPLDKGENVRREICLSIEEMGLSPERSHHEEGPGQNEIDFKYADALTSADQSVIFKNATETIAYKNGLWASFEPKPIANKSGSGTHINVSVKSADGHDIFEAFMSGVLLNSRAMTAIFNPTDNSYLRLGEMKAPSEIFVGNEDRTAFIRVPATSGTPRFELRSPDGAANIYLAYALIIYAGVDGVLANMKLPSEAIGAIPKSLSEAKKALKESEFINKHLNRRLIDRIII